MKKYLTKKTVAACILLLIILCFGSYKYWQIHHAAQKPKTSGELYTVKKMNLQSTVSATGTIKPLESVEISSKITARIKNVLVKENDNVKKGQTVAVLDGKDLENELIKAQETVNNTLSKYNRTKYLYSIGAKSKEDLEDAQYKYATAKSDMEVTKSDLDETVITTPINGVVVGEPKTPGTMAVQGTSNPTIIMRIADLSKKQILAKVDETDIGKIQLGQSAVFTVDAYTDKKFTGRVAKISQTDTNNTWDTSSSSSSSSSSSVIYYYVTLAVNDPQGLLKPSMTARVEITTANKNNVLAIPLSALKTDSKGSYVILVNKNGTTQNKYIQTGIYSDDYVEITSGLIAGDKISLQYTAKKAVTNTSSHHNGPF
ncbi:efflux RND transporter periplasmic adaptor subunit [Pectinatus sottacetonis]|uniref:efflux RND transporter periplasmic adaptor subunit n=1 Tax=Pectinatus sottacetonis TaxID=1002795 RepID=UPI0018C5775B|nr:efflux RND transporter periplasmic adaptor subunit [Pectinatus sottacetonis]